MNQLFVCHTQYDLIMSIAIQHEYYRNEINDLVLFADFAITPKMKEVLKNIFSKTIILHGEYSKQDQKYSKKIMALPKAILDINSFLRNEYDRLFWKCDYSWPEIWLNKKLHRRNSKICVYWLEDGAYFTIGSPIVNLKNNRIKTAIRTAVGKLLFGKYYSFNGVGIGTSSWNEYCCLTYPESVRDKYAGKPFLKVDDEAFQRGISELYSDSKIVLNEGSVLILLDKLDRYKSIHKINEILSNIVTYYRDKNATIYFKYHPRETDSLMVFGPSEVELDKSYGAEGIYASNIGSKIVVIGIASTSLQTAKKSGFDVISLAPIAGEGSKELIDFYNSIGVRVVDDYENIMKD